jgi:hypothetical protein
MEVEVYECLRDAMPLQLTHSHDDSMYVHHNGMLLFTYVYGDYGDVPMEFNRPYLHPVNTLAGDTITLSRPYDTPWHRGISMTLSDVNGQNFYGGPTWDTTTGRFVQLDNIGHVKHIRWDQIDHLKADRERDDIEGRPPEKIVLGHRLHWNTYQGATWFREDRKIVVETVNESTGYWSLRFATSLMNVSGETLTIGSPRTGGHPSAGYGGLFWRGRRSFEGGRVFASSGEANESAMGARARWMAFTGSHDLTLRQSTLIFQDHPANPYHPTSWYARRRPYAGVSFALAYEQPLIVESGQVLDLQYRIIIANGEWTYTPIETILKNTDAVPSLDPQRG